METRLKSTGYEVLKQVDRKSRVIFYHVLVVEKALGKPLSKGAEIHHANGDRADNRNCNLVVCPNRSYHMLLHQRTLAKEMCGNPNWLKCCYCKQYDKPENINTYEKSNNKHHKKCKDDYDREFSRRKRSSKR